MTTLEHEPHPTAPSRPVLAGLSLAIGLVMLLIIVIAIIGGIVYGWKGGVALLILSSIPVCTLATAMTLIALIWRKENKSVAQAALWVNGILGFFAFPIMVFWLVGL